jgi:hypothetical protein
MIHNKRDYKSYYHFANELIKYDKFRLRNMRKDMKKSKNKDERQSLKGLLDLKVIITDDCPALSAAFRDAFYKSKFALCANHFRKNIHKHLKDYTISDKDKQTIVKQIFGTKENRKDGLIGSSSKGIFQDRIKELLEEWGEISSKKSNKKNSSKNFAEWFKRYKVKSFYKYIIKPNLKYPNLLKSYYTTNNVESANNIIKKRLENEKRNSITEISQFFRDISQGQIDKMKLALRGGGELTLSKNFKKYEHSAQTWATMGSEKQEKVINKFLNSSFEEKKTDKSLKRLIKENEN